MEKNHPAFLYRLCFNVFYFLRSCNAYIILIEKASRFENNQIEMNDERSGKTRDRLYDMLLVLDWEVLVQFQGLSLAE